MDRDAVIAYVQVQITKPIVTEYFEYNPITDRLEANKNIDFWQDTVKELLLKNNKIYGIKTGLGINIESKAVILSTGTFMSGIIELHRKYGAFFTTYIRMFFHYSSFFSFPPF